MSGGREDEEGVDEEEYRIEGKCWVGGDKVE